MLVKYPRTHHLPWSVGSTSDDKTMLLADPFYNKEVVVTVKMDGENTTMYSDHIHARSLDSGGHPSRDMVKSIWANVAKDIPAGWRVCGENLYAKHSIQYSNLESYFLVFSIWDQYGICINWDDTVKYADILGLKTVPVIYRGIGNKSVLEKLVTPVHNGDECEGYVVRVAGDIEFDMWSRNVGKYVRENHVSTSEHWMHQTIVPNKLAK